MKIKKRFSAALLGVLLLLSACASSSTPSEGTTQSPGGTAMGRYVEEQLPLPEKIDHIYMLEQMDNGDLLLLGSLLSEKEVSYQYQLWRSTDFGTSWQTESTAWVDALRDSLLHFVQPARDGGFYLFYTTAEQMAEYQRQLMDTLDADDEDAEFSSYPNNTFAHGGENGIEELPFDPPTGSYGGEMSGLKEAANGDLVFYEFFDFYQVDRYTGRVIETYEVEKYLTDGSFYVLDNILYVFQDDGLVSYDLESRTMLENGSNGQALTGSNVRLVGTSTNSILTVDEEHGVMYHCNASGIYSSYLDGVSTERLVDGELTSLAMPSLNKARLYARDDRFLVLCSSDTGSYLLFRYEYDSTVPTVPTTELKVYSLENNPTIRQAVSTFQLRNPDVKVTYTVGMTGEDGVTASDAMRSLSNQLIAGDGPDVLVLDGLPVDSYISQGVLLDLEETFSDDFARGRYMENVASTYRDGDSLWAIPARFTTYFLFGDSDAVNAIRTPDAMLEWLQQHPDTKMIDTRPSLLVNEWYPILSSNWFGEDGTLDEAAFRQSIDLLDNVGEIQGTLNDMQINDSISMLFSSAMWLGGHIDFGVGEITELFDLTMPYSALETKGRSTGQPIRDEYDEDADSEASVAGENATSTGAFRAFPRDNGIFEPKTILGVGAGSKQQELAVGFIRTVLDDEVLVNSFHDGIPVTRSAIAQNTADPYDGGNSNMAYGFSVSSSEDADDYISAHLTIQWPDEAFIGETLAALDSLTVAVPRNEVVRQMVLEEAYVYFDGGQTLDQTVDNLKQKLNIYLAEQR